MFCIDDSWLFGFKVYPVQPCGYIDTTYVAQIKRVGKKLLNMINSKVVRRKTHTRARERHKKCFDDEVGEEYDLSV